jgi:serine protease Do
MSLWGDGFTEYNSPSAGVRRRRPTFSAVLTALLLGTLLVGMVMPFFLEPEPIAGGADVAAFAAKEADLAEAARAFNRLFVQARERVQPAVVSVINHPEEQENGVSAGFGLGSGIIFDRIGDTAYVATNHHVIEGSASLEVVLTDGTRRPAQLVGSDLFSDLAVLTMDGEGVERVALFGDSDRLEVSEFVIAIGNPLGLSYSHTTTFGIISSLRTPVPVSLSFGQVDWEMELIQIDAAINRGNSGGALVNLDGEVVGINNMKVSDFGVEGLGFAIPSNVAVDIINDLLAYGKVPRPFLGVAMRDLALVDRRRNAVALPDNVTEGVYVMSAEGPAAEAGLAEGDVIVQFDDTPVESSLALRKYLYGEKKIGDRVTIIFFRDGKRHATEAVLGERE